MSNDWDDYEFRGRMSPSGRIHGQWRKDPNPGQYRAIFMILLIGIPICAVVWLMFTNNFLGTGEPEGPKEVYADYRGVWTATGKLPGEKEVTTIRVSVPTESRDESRIEFTHPKCSARMKVDGILNHFTTFSMQGEPAGKSKWCGDIYEVMLYGDWGGDNFEKKLSDKVTLTVTTGRHSDEQLDIVDDWPATRLKNAFKPAPSSSPERPTDLPKAFKGIWTGGPIRSDGKRPEYSVTLNLKGGRVGHQVGTVTYPELGCSGTVSLKNGYNTSTEINLEEQLISDPEKMCTDGELMIPQHIDLELKDDGTLAFESIMLHWDPDSKPNGAAVLTRK